MNLDPNFRNNIPFLDEKDLKFLEILGEGGFGCVCKAYEKTTSKYFALKYFKFSEDSDILIEDMILDQIQQINNPDFLQYYGIYRDSKTANGYVLKMESGTMTLQNFLKMSFSFEESEVIYILNSLVSQMALLQIHGIANRDIKPMNVIIVEDNEKINNFYFKIADFGSGCILENPAKNMIPCASIGEITEKYASPEALKAFSDDETFEKQLYDPFKSDVYSLGLTILSLLGFSLENYKTKDCKLKEILQKMLEIYPEDRADFQEIKKYMSNLMKYAKKPTKISSACQKWPEFKMQTKSIKDKVETYFKYFKAYKDISRYEPAEFYICECEKYQADLDGIDKKLIEDLYFELAWYYAEIKYNFEKAKQFFDKSVQLKLQLYGEESIEMAMVYNVLGLYCSKVERNDEKTEGLYNKSIELFIKVCNGENHEELARPYHNLAMFYKEKKESELAEHYHMKSLEVRRRLSGEEHKETAWNYNSIAHFYWDRKEYDKAEENFKKGLEIRVRVLGEEHADCVQSYWALGNFYWKVRKNFGKAEEFLKKAAIVSGKIYGNTHQETANMVQNLKNMQKAMQK